MLELMLLSTKMTLQSSTKMVLVIVPPKTAQNSEEGFSEMLSSFSYLDRSQEIKMGFEVTNHTA